MRAILKQAAKIKFHRALSEIRRDPIDLLVFFGGLSEVCRLTWKKIPSVRARGGLALVEDTRLKYRLRKSFAKRSGNLSKLRKKKFYRTFQK
jgi:hypothetical protein